MKRLDRHMVDIVARAVVSGRRGRGARIDRLADLVAGLMRNRLEACGAPGALVARHLPQAQWPAVRAESRLLDLLLERAGKHLASGMSITRGRSRDASPHPP